MKTSLLAVLLVAAGLLVLSGTACLEPTFECSPSTCWGCCDEHGSCQLGNTLFACGVGGGQCDLCRSSQLCHAGACVSSGECNAATCATGCCSAAGCQSGDSWGACGRAGEACLECGAGQSCVNQACAPWGTPDSGSSCGPESCSGCCSGTGAAAVCVIGTSIDQCGKAGAQCKTCLPAAGEVCQAQTCVASACTAKSCPTGCCYGSGSSAVCMTGTTSANCGTGGGQCKSCSSSQLCLNGACMGLVDGGTSCSAATCPKGCCASFGGYNACMPGTSGYACGSAGRQCDVCSGGQSCVNQVCSGGMDGGWPGCNATNCPTGCCSGNGPSSICLLGNTSANCGTGGARCRTCNNAAGEVCSNKTCTGGVDAGTALMGTPCSSNSQCAGLGGNYRCKLTTNPGGAVYSGGYCTRTCGSNNDCTSDSFCVSVPAQYGENDRFCWKRCSTGSTCRQGYACYTVGMNSGCWIYPAPTADAGAPADKIGASCSTDPQCQNPPNDGFCIPAIDPSGAASGWTNGYCSADCVTSAHCGDGGTCLDTGSGQSVCLQECSPAGTGQASCRTGYVCQSLTMPTWDGGSSLGICIPDCNNPGAGCDQGGVCQASGYCF